MFLIPFALNWTFRDLQINPQLFMVAPTGTFVKGHLANVSKNIWYFDPVLGLSYLSHKTGTELTVFAGVGFATEDQDTGYQNGDVFHLEATLQQYLPLGSKQNLLGIGVNGFYFQQITGDSGPGARLLGANEGTDIGLGPVVTFIHSSSKYNFSVQAKWLREIDTKNRLSGDWVWVAAGVEF